jgi:hypothetical protein
MVTAPEETRDTRTYERFFLRDVQVEDATHEEAERQRARGAAHDPQVISFLDEIAAGAVKKVRFRDKSVVKGQYMSLARIAAWRGLYLERIQDRDDDLVCYIRKRADSDERAAQARHGRRTRRAGEGAHGERG